MSETHETIADIIAEMRGADNRCQLATKDGTGCYHCPFGSAASNCVFDNYANRLEAALKRERGDCAKLREALATIRKRLVAAYESEAGFMRSSPNKPLVDLIDAALAAPPRNCDVMDWRTAWKMWREKFHPETPVGYSAVVKGTEAFMDWFTAPATEKEGGNDDK